MGADSVELMFRCLAIVVVFGVLAIAICATVAVVAVRALQLSNRMLRAQNTEFLETLSAYHEDQRQLMYHRGETERAAMALTAARDASRPSQTDEWIGGAPPEDADEVARMPTANTGL